MHSATHSPAPHSLGPDLDQSPNLSAPDVDFSLPSMSPPPFSLEASSETVEKEKDQEVEKGSEGGGEGFAALPPPDDVNKKNQSTEASWEEKVKTQVGEIMGADLQDVSVNYNSGLPKQFKAHALAQAREVFIAPGQESHLPHELVHVVQQDKGLVKADRESSQISINEDPALEQEAETIGQKVLRKLPFDGNTEGARPSTISSIKEGQNGAPLQLKRINASLKNQSKSHLLNFKGEKVKKLEYLNLPTFFVETDTFITKDDGIYYAALNTESGTVKGYVREADLNYSVQEGKNKGQGTSSKSDPAMYQASYLDRMNQEGLWWDLDDHLAKEDANKIKMRLQEYWDSFLNAGNDVSPTQTHGYISKCLQALKSAFKEAGNKKDSASWYCVGILNATIPALEKQNKLDETDPKANAMKPYQKESQVVKGFQYPDSFKKLSPKTQKTVNKALLEIELHAELTEEETIDTYLPKIQEFLEDHYQNTFPDPDSLEENTTAQLNEKKIEWHISEIVREAIQAKKSPKKEDEASEKKESGGGPFEITSSWGDFQEYVAEGGEPSLSTADWYQFLDPTLKSNPAEAEEQAGEKAFTANWLEGKSPERQKLDADVQTMVKELDARSKTFPKPFQSFLQPLHISKDKMVFNLAKYPLVPAHPPIFRAGIAIPILPFLGVNASATIGAAIGLNSKLIYNRADKTVFVDGSIGGKIHGTLAVGAYVGLPFLNISANAETGLEGTVQGNVEYGPLSKQLPIANGKLEVGVTANASLNLRANLLFFSAELVSFWNASRDLGKVVIRSGNGTPKGEWVTNNNYEKALEKAKKKRLDGYHFAHNSIDHFTGLAKRYQTVFISPEALVDRTEIDLLRKQLIACRDNKTEDGWLGMKDIRSKLTEGNSEEQFQNLPVFRKLAQLEAMLKELLSHPQVKDLLPPKSKKRVEALGYTPEDRTYDYIKELSSPTEKESAPKESKPQIHVQEDQNASFEDGPDDLSADLPEDSGISSKMEALKHEREAQPGMGLSNKAPLTSQAKNGESK